MFDLAVEKLLHKVTLNKTVTISIGPEVHVDASVRGKHNVDGRTSTIESAGALFSKTSVRVCKLLVIPANHSVPVCVFNLHDEPI